MPIVRIALALALFVGALSTSANAKSAADSSPNAYIHSLVQSSSCTKLKVISPKGSEGAAIVVPISLNGKRYWFQLDTGAANTILYGKKIVQNIPSHAVHSRTARIDNVKLAGQKLGPRLFARMKDAKPGKYHISGTLGLDLLMDHATVLDFPDRRFCLFNPLVATRLDRFHSGVHRVTGNLYNGHMTFNLHVDNQQIKNVMYDSGSSPIALEVPKQQWQHLTGRSGPKDATKVAHMPSWGKPISLVWAPMKGTLRLGDMRFKNPLATYVTGSSFNLSANGYGGLLGNALFMHDTVVLRMSSVPRLYVIPRSKKSDDGGDS